MRCKFVGTYHQKSNDEEIKFGFDYEIEETGNYQLSPMYYVGPEIANVIRSYTRMDYSVRGGANFVFTNGDRLIVNTYEINNKEDENNKEFENIKFIKISSLDDIDKNIEKLNLVSLTIPCYEIIISNILIPRKVIKKYFFDITVANRYIKEFKDKLAIAHGGKRYVNRKTKTTIHPKNVEPLYFKNGDVYTITTREITTNDFFNEPELDKDVNRFLEI